MRILAFVTEGAVIDRILAHLRRAREAARGPPPDRRPAALARQAIRGFKYLFFGRHTLHRGNCARLYSSPLSRVGARDNTSWHGPGVQARRLTRAGAVAQHRAIVADA